MKIKYKNIVIKINSKHIAFSLLELMFVLVAVSVLMAAFVPVITNSYSKDVEMVSSTGKNLTSGECDINFKNDYGLICTLCYGDESCVTCGGECPSGKVKKKEKCTCE